MIKLKKTIIYLKIKRKEILHLDQDQIILEFFFFLLQNLDVLSKLLLCTRKNHNKYLYIFSILSSTLCLKNFFSKSFEILKPFYEIFVLFGCSFVGDLILMYNRKTLLLFQLLKPNSVLVSICAISESIILISESILI